MKKYLLIIIIFLFFISSLYSCDTTKNSIKTSWVERLILKTSVENEYLYAECAYIDRDSMIKNISSEGLNPFLYKDPIITKQESIMFSLLIIPKIDFFINSNEISIKTEYASYPAIFKEYVLENNLYETELDSVTKEMKNFVQKYFISKKENYKTGERKVRFIYAILNYDYKGAIVRIPIHTLDDKISVLNFIFPEIKR